MIYPTLFIGLGTQGLHILEELQKLVIEEYGEKPSIFEYVYFETAEKNKPAVQVWAKNEIRTPQPFPVIRKLQEFRDEFDDGKRNYLRQWLNEDLLSHPSNAFVDGAGHIRMAGRLCLWANWMSCRATIQGAKNTITGDTEFDQTQKFLKSFYVKVGKRIPPGDQLIDKQPRVYIVGTFCGGTCGGMFIDIAYLIREMFDLRGGSATAKLKGIFTVLDSTILGQPKDNVQRKQAANCWASLIELDYYSHREAEYAITWPDNDSVSMSDPPFDYVYLLSCTGNDSNLRITGEPDIKALNQMAAMVLFSETVSDLLEEKEDIIINFTGDKDFTTPFCETRQGMAMHSPHEDMPVFGTCGLCAFWYPKYRIAEAAACHVGKEICSEWLGTIDADTRQRIEQSAEKLWLDMLREALPLLTRKPGGSIEDEIRRWFDAQRGTLLQLSISQMQVHLVNHIMKLEEEKDYDNELSRPERLTEFECTLTETLRNAIVRVVNETSNLSYAEYLLKRFDLAIESTIQGLPVKYPRPERSKLEGAIDVDRWARIVWRGKLVAQQKKEDFLNRCLDYFIECLVLIRGFRARPILGKLKKYLGVSIEPAGDEVITFRTVRQELNAMRSTLEQSVADLGEKETERSQVIEVQQTMRLIYEGNQNSIEEDVRNLNARLYKFYQEQKEPLLRKMMTVGVGNQQRVLPLFEFVNTEKDNIIRSLVGELRLRSLDVIGRFNIAQKLFEREDPETLRLFAHRAEPYLELAGKLIEVPDPHFMVGNDDPGAPNLNGLRDKVLNLQTAKNRIDFGDPIESPLIDHLLIFYKEKGLLYKNENFATSELFKTRYEEIAKTEKYGLFTHRNGEYEFDPRKGKRKKAVVDMMMIATDLFFFVDNGGQWHKSEVIAAAEVTQGLQLKLFGIVDQNQQLVMRFKRKDGIDSTLLFDTLGTATLVEEPYVFELFKGELSDIFACIGDAGYSEAVNHCLKRLEEKLRSRGTPLQQIIEQRESLRKQFIERKEKFLVKQTP